LFTLLADGEVVALPAEGRRPRCAAGRARRVMLACDMEFLHRLAGRSARRNGRAVPA
jgi:hypothetical protein